MARGSSIGLDTKEPSGSCTEESEGARSSFSTTSTSHTTGPGTAEDAADFGAEVVLICDVVGCQTVSFGDLAQLR